MLEHSLLVWGTLATACVVGGVSAIGAFATGNITSDLGGLMAIMGGFSAIALGANIGYEVYRESEREFYERIEMARKERSRARTQERADTREQGLSKALSETKKKTVTQAKAGGSSVAEAPKEVETAALKAKGTVKKTNTQKLPIRPGMDPNG